MKNYTITVNGNVYDVAVEEKGCSVAPATTPAQAAPVQAAAPVAAAAAPVAPAPVAAASNTQGSLKVTSPMPGKILSVKAQPGQALKKGDVILLLEAMKMENEVVAQEDGTLATVNCNAGDMVEAGDLLATLN